MNILFIYSEKLFVSKKTEKERLITKAEKIYQKELDVINILKKLHEIENLKLLLLDENQLVLFNYLTKPYISLTKNNDEEIKRRFSECIVRKNDHQKFCDSYIFF